MKKIFTLITMLTMALSMNAAYYVAGDGAGTWCDGKSWDPAGSLMTDNGDGTHSITFNNVAEGIHQFKITDGSWANNWGYDNVDKAASGKVENGGGNVKFNCAEGDVTITFNEANHNIVVLFNEGGEVVITSWTACGDAAIFAEGAWNPANTTYDLSKEGDIFVLKLAEVTLAKGSYQYKVVGNHAWGIAEYPASGNYMLDIPESGKYNITITFDPATTTVTAEAALVSEEEVEVNYYIKNCWDGGDWTWQQMTKDGDVYTFTGNFGGVGVNVNNNEGDAGANWFAVESIEGDEVAEGDNVTFTYNAETGVLTVKLNYSTGINNIKVAKNGKFVQNGKVVIIRNGVKYNVNGTK